ncbi:hypothetical protein ColKHC_08122 [Colletotrichum higginsianum]|nr:hypothetical protein ColKHC_08122 [Colletotrichum higginsianum]
MSTARVRFFLLEATFTFLFFARVKFKIEYIFDDILPWKREDVSWQLACSHSALMERPRGLFDMTDEQVVAYNTERQKRIKEQQAIKGKRWEAEQRATDLKGFLAKKLRQRLAWQEKNKDKVLATAVGCNAERQKRNAAANSKQWIAKERAQNLKGYHAKSLKRRLAWQEKNKDKALATASGVRARAVASTLRKHMASKAHIEQVQLAEGGAPKVVSVEAARSWKFSAKHKAFNIKGHLNKHNGTKKHLAEVAAAAKAAAANAKRQKHIKEQQAIKGKRWEAEQRATDLKGYLAKKLKQKLAWEAKNKDKVLATAFGVRARAIASRRHECKICGIGLQSVTALRKHLASKAHLEQVRLAEGGAPKVVSVETTRCRKFSAKHKAAKTYYCPVCDWAFNIKLKQKLAWEARKQGQGPGDCFRCSCSNRRPS